MLFCSLQFFLFFAIVFVLYWTIPWHAARIWLLLAASFYFYASWNHWLALLVFFSTTADYLLARGMDVSRSPRVRRFLWLTSLSGNLGLLVYFKYANFFLESLSLGLQSIGHAAAIPTLRIILPIGISFYTFEAISYTTDVYLGRLKAERSLSSLLLFITFFPHLVAGPIVRGRHFLSQTHRWKKWSWSRVNLGVQYILMGLFKKVAVADRMAFFADPIFANPDQYRTSALWLGVIAYSMQIYCDFSGYSDMAIGLAHMLGFKLPRNFKLPYLAANISEFWRRWHITLSSWLRDYLYIPLGGSLRGAPRTAINILITMSLGGLWHGANWTFVIWGAAHGILLAIHRSFRSLCESKPRWRRFTVGRLGMAAGVGLTFSAVTLCWILFRSPGLGTAATMFIRLFSPHPGMTAPLQNTSLWSTVLALSICDVLAHSVKWKQWNRRLPAPVIGFGYAAMLTLIMVLAPEPGRAFIYFQF